MGQAIELGNLPPVKSAGTVVKSIIYNNPGLSAHVIVSGWDPYKGYQIYDINQTGFMSEGDCILGGSGGHLIMSYADLSFKPGMTLDEAKAFIATGIQLAISRDNGSGGNIRMMNITEEGCKREMIPQNEFNIK